MPIRPENKARYPVNWRTEVRPAILKRAQDKCEQCGVPNGADIYRDDAGEWHRCLPDNRYSYSTQPALLHTAVKCMGYDVVTIVLTIAHLDHTPEHNDPSNLRAWCQRCHLAYDAQHHAQTAYATRRQGKALDLFDDATHDQRAGSEGVGASEVGTPA